ncbi:MAG: hypothetical protein AAB906_00685 [Patescibacteria group bacterium]
MIHRFYKTRVQRFVFQFGESPELAGEDEKPKIKFKFKEKKPMIAGPEEPDTKSTLDDSDQDVTLEEVEESHIDIARQVLKEMRGKPDSDTALIDAKLALLNKIDTAKLSAEDRAQYIDDVLLADASEFAEVLKRLNAGLAGGTFEVE